MTKNFLSVLYLHLLMFFCSSCVTRSSLISDFENSNNKNTSWVDNCAEKSKKKQLDNKGLEDYKLTLKNHSSQLCSDIFGEGTFSGESSKCTPLISDQSAFLMGDLTVENISNFNINSEKLSITPCPNFEKFIADTITRKKQAEEQRKKEEIALKLAEEERKRNEIAHKIAVEKRKIAAEEEERERRAILIKLKARGASHKIFISFMDAQGRACDEQLDGDWICRIATLCPLDSRINDLTDLVNKCADSAATKDFVFTPTSGKGLMPEQFDHNRGRPMIFGGLMILDGIAVKRAKKNKVLKNGFGKKFPAANWIEVSQSHSLSH